MAADEPQQNALEDTALAGWDVRDAAELARGTRVGRYTILEILGRGAMGVTYKAFDERLRVDVALKVIAPGQVHDAKAQALFLREARAAAQVHHPNVAGVVYLNDIPGDFFYAMEFVEGESLDTLIRRFRRLETKLALEITTQVAGGLAAIHGRNLVHRDIKPSNVMVNLKDHSSVAKIIYLGLAKGAA